MKVGEEGREEKLCFLVDQYQPAQPKKFIINSVHLDQCVKKTNFIFISLCSWICHKLQLLRRQFNAAYPKSLFLEKLSCVNVLKYIFAALFSFS